MASETETALLVEVPAADAAVGPYRDILDLAAGWGVPAHLTVLYPFVPPAQLDDEVRSVVADIAATVPAFELTLAGIEWFGADLVWLAPDDPEPLRQLTARVVARFPDHQPYGGEITDPTPHLTVAHLGTLADRRAAAAAVLPRLPIRQRVTEVALWAGSPEPAAWHRCGAFPLGRSLGDVHRHR